MTRALAMFLIMNEYLTISYKDFALLVFLIIKKFRSHNLYHISRNGCGGLWTSLTSRDLNDLWVRSELPLMYGTEEYFLVNSSSESVEADPVFGIISIQSGHLFSGFQRLLNVLNFLYFVKFFRHQDLSSK